MYTDYNNVAIVHECDNPNVDGSCPMAHRHVDVLSRDPDGPVEGTKKRVAPTALSLCVRRRDFRKTSKPGQVYLSKLKIFLRVLLKCLSYNEFTNDDTVLASMEDTMSLMDYFQVCAK